jgi:hypothetical protein
VYWGLLGVLVPGRYRRSADNGQMTIGLDLAAWLRINAN